MKFENFDNTDEKGKRTDYNQQVTKSTSSQANKADARGKPSTYREIEEAMESLQLERDTNNVRVAQIQCRLSVINNLIRGNRLPRHDYQKFCDEQSVLKAEQLDLITRNKDMKMRLATLEKDRKCFSTSGQDEGVKSRKMTNRLLRLILEELRILNGQPRSVVEKPVEG